MLLVLITACADATTTTVPDEPTTTLSATTTEATITTTTLESTTTIATDAAPAEMRGVWTLESSSGETLQLVLQGTSYQARVQGTPETGSGTISVDGDTIAFYGSDRCPDDPGGTYTWVIEDGTLTFTLVGQDACGRKGFLDGFSYTFDSALP